MSISEHSTANSEVLNPRFNVQTGIKPKPKHEINSEAPEVAKLMQELNPPKDEANKFHNFMYWNNKRRAEVEKEMRLFNNAKG